MTKAEFIREALRDKIKALVLGRHDSGEPDEKEILKDVEVMGQIERSEKNIKKGKVKRFSL